MNALSRPDTFARHGTALQSLAEAYETIDQLRARVAWLEDQLGANEPVPPCLGLTPAEAATLRVLLKRDIALKSAIMAATADFHDDERDGKIVDVLVCKLRKKLRRYKITVQTERGAGFRMSAETKARTRALQDASGDLKTIGGVVPTCDGCFAPLRIERGWSRRCPSCRRKLRNMQRRELRATEAGKAGRRTESLKRASRRETDPAYAERRRAKDRDYQATVGKLRREARAEAKARGVSTDDVLRDWRAVPAMQEAA